MSKWTNNAVMIKENPDELTLDEQRIVREAAELFDKVLFLYVVPSVHSQAKLNTLMYHFQLDYADVPNLDVDWVYFVNDNMLDKHNIIYVINPKDNAQAGNLWPIYLL